MSTHLEAVEATICAASTVLGGRQAALLQLVRTLAQQMDTAGPDPSTRLSAAYLSALKDLGRVLATGPEPTAKPRSALAAVRSMRARA